MLLDCFRGGNDGQGQPLQRQSLQQAGGDMHAVQTEGQYKRAYRELHHGCFVRSSWVASATAELLRLQELTLLWLCLSRRHASQGFQGISRAEIMCALLQADKVPSAGGKESGCLCETAPCLRTQLMKGRSQECITTGLYIVCTPIWHFLITIFISRYAR